MTIMSIAFFDVIVLHYQAAMAALALEKMFVYIFLIFFKGFLDIRMIQYDPSHGTIVFFF